MNSSTVNPLHTVNPKIYIGLLASSPIGALWVAISDRGLAVVEWSMSQENFTRLIEKRFQAAVVYDESRTNEPLHQIKEYLAGTRRHFDLPLDLASSSNFQRSVLGLTTQVPYGHTTTYKDIAIQLGKMNAARAVGRVEATNPIPLVIPCHRVLGSDGTLHGYGGPGGIKLKAWLLELERSYLK